MVATAGLLMVAMPADSNLAEKVAAHWKSIGRCLESAAAVSSKELRGGSSM